MFEDLEEINPFIRLYFLIAKRKKNRSEVVQINKNLDFILFLKNKKEREAVCSV